MIELIEHLPKLFLIIFLCIFIYYILKDININNFKEGMTSDASGNSTAGGIAGNAATYAANIKSEAIKLQDVLLASKYTTDYENVILNLDSLIENLMLKTTLSIDPKKPIESFKTLVSLNESKVALNNVMKFIDGH